MKRWALLVFTVILVLGGIARFYRLDEKSLWSDEIATIASSMGNSIDPEAYALRGESFDPPAPVPAEVYKLKATQSHGAGNLARTSEVLKANVHPPLFFWLMNLWIHAVGLEPGLLRIPAVVFGILSIALMGGLAWRFTRWAPEAFTGAGRQIFPLLASAMMAFSAYQIDHAQDARQYTLLICLALGSVWLMVDLIQQSGKSAWRWVGLALLLTTGLYSQYFFLLFAMFVMGTLLWQARREKTFLLGVSACGLLILLLFSPWLAVFREQLVFLKMAGHYTSGLWNPLQLPEKLWRILCEFFLPDSDFGKVMPLLVLLGWGGSLWFARKNAAPQAPSGNLSPVLALLLAWPVFLVGGQIALDLIKHSHTATIRRYLLLASPAAYFLMAYALCAMPRNFGSSRWRWLPAGLTALLLTLIGMDSLNTLLKSHHSSDEFNLAAARINQVSGPHDLVLVNKTGAMASGLAYYLHPETRMLGVDVPTSSVLNADSALMNKLSRSVATLPKDSSVWLVFSHSSARTRNRLIDWLERQGYHTGEGVKVPGVRVYQAKK